MTRLLAAAALCLASGLGHAATCSVATTGIDFGPYPYASANDVDATAEVTVTCAIDGLDLEVGYDIAFSAGGSSDFAGRIMSGPNGGLGYNLYTDPNRMQVWGDGTAGTATVSGGFTLPATSSATHTAYGRIPAQQLPWAGSYGDQLTIVVTY